MTSGPLHGARPFLLALLVALALTSCGVSARTVATGEAPGPSASNVQASVPPPEARAGAGGAPAAPASAPAKASSLPAVAPGQMLIRTATIDLEVKDPAAAAASVRQIAAAAVDGADLGFVSDEKYQDSAGSTTATITLRVPTPLFGQVIEQLRHVGTRVVSETSTSQDVTEQFVDVDAQLQSLKATQSQLFQLLTKATTLADTLTIQQKLTDIQTQINQLEGRENYLKAHSAYASITVTLHAPSVSLVRPGAWSPLATLLRALSALWVVGQRILDVLVWLLVFGVPIALLGLAAVGLRGLATRTLAVRRGGPKA